MFRHYRLKNCNYFKCSAGLSMSCWCFADIWLGDLAKGTFNFKILHFGPLKTSYMRMLPITWLQLLDNHGYQWARPGFEPRISRLQFDWSTIKLTYHFTNNKNLILVSCIHFNFNIDTMCNFSMDKFDEQFYSCDKFPSKLKYIKVRQFIAWIEI